MSSINSLFKLTLLLFLLIPISALADVKIILGTPYYSYKHSGHYHQVDSYAKRHNFGNNYYPTNPYSNNKYSYYSNRNRYYNQTTVPRISFGYNSFYRNNYGYNRSTNNKFNRIYEKGYRQGYRDAKKERYYRRHNFKLGR